MFREYVGSGQAIKLELSRDYSDEDAIRINAQVADGDLGMNLQLRKKGEFIKSVEKIIMPYFF